jgi:peptide/nickel transport system permease protein
VSDEGPRAPTEGRLVEGSLEDAAASQVAVGEVPAGLEAAPAPGDRGSARRERWRLLLRSPTFLIGAVVVLFWLACALFPHLLERYDPLQTNILQKFKPPSGEHWFGTDDLGRDVYARVIAGARAILVIAPLATLLGTVAGTAIGLLTGYRGGWLDEGLMRIVDAFLAIPTVILATMVLAGIGSSNFAIIVVIGLVFTPIIARTVRAAVLGERELEYVQAAQLRHERSAYVMFVEILPNVMGPILVEFTVRVGYAIFAIAVLSFLGFGIQPPSPDWGSTISVEYIFLPAGFWWPTLFPALAIASLVIAVNLISDSVAQVIER